MAEEQIEYRVEVEGAANVLVRDFTFVEAISRPYTLDVEISVPVDTDVPALLGKDLVFTMLRPDFEERTVGLVTQVRAVGHETIADTDTVGLIIALRIEPALALLALRRNSRIFQEKKVEEIVQAVLDEAFGPYSRSAEFSLDGSYEPHEYVVQYEESDLDFVHRLLEEEGIHYLFDHAGEQEVMKLGDRNGAFPEQGTIPFVATGSSTELHELVFRFGPARRAAITHVTHRDWSFLSAGGALDGEAGSDDPDCAGERRLYDHGIDRKPVAGMLKTRAGFRVEAHRVRAAERSGVAHAIQIRPGRIFELSGAPTVGADGAYLVIEAVHEKSSAESARAFSRRGTYGNRFRCVPSDVSFRPPRITEKPRIEGVESATVTGPSGQEIHPDEHGRVKVLFAWDRLGPSDETSSAWVRVEQPWAGDGWGWMFVPRMGMEVIVEFVDGNPDRPLITGCVYNGANLPPYTLPDEKTKSTFKTQSSLGGGGFNELRFEDKAGSEQIFLHAQKDFDEEVLNNHTTDVKQDQTNTVDGNQTQDIGVDQTETVEKDASSTVNKNRILHVKVDYEETIDGGELRAIKGGSDELYKVKETHVVVGGIKEMIIGPEKLVVDGAKSETITGGQMQGVLGPMTENITGGPSSTTATGMINVLSTGNVIWKGGAGLTIQAGAMYNLIAPPNITFTATGIHTDNSTVLVQLGALNIGLTGEAKAFTNLAVGVYGRTAAATGLSQAATILSLSKTSSARGWGAYSFSLTGIKLVFGSYIEYKKAAEADL